MEWVGDVRLAAGPEAAWYLEAAFAPGAKLGTVYDDPTTPVVVTGIEELTAIRVPSGRLVVDAPFHDDQVWEYQRGLPTRPPRELAVRIPPGVYRVEIAWTAGPYEFMGEHVDGVECAATRLRISDDPVVGREMGLGVEEDIDRLQPGEEPRFFSDANVGCFADAGAWTTLSTPFRTFTDGAPAPRDTEQLADGCERVRDESQQADLVTFGAESGGVVWLGRTKTGDVAAIVVTSGLPDVAPHGPGARGSDRDARCVRSAIGYSSPIRLAVHLPQASTYGSHLEETARRRPRSAGRRDRVEPLVVEATAPRTSSRPSGSRRTTRHQIVRSAGCGPGSALRAVRRCWAVRTSVPLEPVFSFGHAAFKGVPWEPPRGCGFVEACFVAGRVHRAERAAGDEGGRERLEQKVPDVLTHSRPHLGCACSGGALALVGGADERKVRRAVVPFDVPSFRRKRDPRSSRSGCSVPAQATFRER